MKRIFALILALSFLLVPLSASAHDVYTTEKLTYTNANTTIPYRLILPDDFSEDKEYPMLVFFHGAGERGNDNELQLFHNVQYIHDNAPEDVIILAPQCPLNNQWVDTPWVNGAYSTSLVAESNEMKAVIELVLQLQESHKIEKDRTYVAGISMGGFATWDALMRHNDIFAAGIPVCGGGDIAMGEELKETPIFTFHAVNDTAVPVSGTRDTVKAIRDAGGELIEYTEYATGGHGIWNQAFATEGLFDKLFACRLSARYPEMFESSEEVVSEPAAEISEPEAEAEDSFPVGAIVAMVAAVVCAILAVIVALIKKKK